MHKHQTQNLVSIALRRYTIERLLLETAKMNGGHEETLAISYMVVELLQFMLYCQRSYGSTSPVAVYTGA